MSPYEIHLLLHYYCRAEDHPDMQRNPPVWRPTIEAFLAADMLRVVPVDEQNLTYPMCYGLTSRGRFYVEALQRVPRPESRWYLP